MELSRYLRVLRRRLWMIVVCPIVAALAAGVVSFLLPPVYEAHVSLLVRPSQPLASTDPTAAALTADQISRTYASLMTQRPLLESVIKELGINVRPDDLAKEITVTPETNTTILDVAVRDTNPALARDLANQLTADLISEVKGFQQEETALPNARTGDNLLVVSPAVLPDRPVSPNKSLNVAIAFAAGLLLALGLAFLTRPHFHGPPGVRLAREREARRAGRPGRAVSRIRSIQSAQNQPSLFDDRPGVEGAGGDLS
jgi:capsular polysaccharide biosynthesis protein